MLTELCQNLHNWFDRGQPKWIGRLTIADNVISFENGSVSLKEGQYYRIMGSTFNDGVHFYPSSDLADEEFEGAVWAMAVPPAVIALASDIEAWENKYGGVDGVVYSPYTSESFGGYSYSKSSGYNSASGNGVGIGWQDIFASRLNMWRKLP